LTKSVLETALTPEVSKSFLHLQRYWSCAVSDTAPGGTPHANTSGLSTGRQSAQAKTKLSASEKDLVSLKNGTANSALETGPKINPSWSIWAIIQLLLVSLSVALTMLRYQQQSDDRRRSKRHNVNIPISMKFRGKNLPITLVEVSLSGCKISHRHRELKSKKVKLNFPERSKRARVVWQNELYAGIQFRNPLELEMLKALLGYKQSEPEFDEAAAAIAQNIASA